MPYLSNYVNAAVFVLDSLTTRVIIISQNYRYRDEKYLGGIYSRNRRRAIRRTPLKREASWKKEKKEKENTENIANTLEEESKGRWSFRNEAKAVYHFPINQSVNRLYASR